MNSLRLSGTLVDDPRSTDHENIVAASATIIFALESTVDVLTVGGRAQELCGYRKGDGIIVTGRLAGKNGKLEILAEHLAPFRAVIYERAQAAKREVPSISIALPMTRPKRPKAAKKHW